jgi:putative FmdB family regulatory protein
MPIYTYRCENCGVQFEQQQSFNDEPLKRCPQCNKNKLRRVITPSGIVFKGSGWYATDHKAGSKSAVKPAPVKTGAENKNDSKSESKDSAPAASTSTSGDSGTSSKSDSGGSKSSSGE